MLSGVLGLGSVSSILVDLEMGCMSDCVWLMVGFFWSYLGLVFMVYMDLKDDGMCSDMSDLEIVLVSMALSFLVPLALIFILLDLLKRKVRLYV